MAHNAPANIGEIEHSQADIILVVLALLFLMSFLDRTNVGNAKIIGLEADLSITDHLRKRRARIGRMLGEVLASAE
jgi:hypothetical protein